MNEPLIKEGGGQRSRFQTKGSKPETKQRQKLDKET
jgi:hypothetical protein